ncbi:hypothetical protein OHA37_07600 [Streptomyces sp. NBC_00335]|uniref:hypothetical protein n=1 Tax=unclassified Streptomyces TaxID=2593676 RepID=UPI002258F5B0|nr:MULTISPECIES: hypothetical protein [unclassified Streptomyces]MCX5403748.1 hypothetical protein [Streptomyces sp. NBC_00086]
MDPEEEHGGEVVLSAAEYEAVGAALSSLPGPARGGPAPSLDHLLQRWKDLVDEVEEGYGWCAPELDNDLACRAALARIWPLLPPRVRAIRQPELDSADERYRLATVPWPGRPEATAGWWKWRIPRRLEVEACEERGTDWPTGWEMMPFPRPAAVEVST